MAGQIRHMKGAAQLQQGIRPVDESTKNCQLLGGCPRHVFTLVPNLKHARAYKCDTCGGEIDATALYWFEAGVKQGKADAESTRGCDPGRGEGEHQEARRVPGAAPVPGPDAG